MGPLLAILSGAQWRPHSFILLSPAGTWKPHRSDVWDQLVLSALLCVRIHGDPSETSLLSVSGFGILSR